MTTDLSPAKAPTGLRPRFSMGQLMALIGAVAAITALYVEMARQAALPSPTLGADPAVLTCSIVVASIAVAGLRRSSPTGMLLALSLSASAIALYGSLRHTRYAAFGPPAFALLTVALPLWIRRGLGGDPSTSTSPRSGWPRRLMMAGRVGLDSSLNLLGLMILLVMFGIIGGILPTTGAGVVPTLRFGGNLPVYPSASSVVLTNGIVAPPQSSPMVPIPPGSLPEFAPPPPEIDFETATPPNR